MLCCSPVAGHALYDLQQQGGVRRGQHFQMKFNRRARSSAGSGGRSQKYFRAPLMTRSERDFFQKLKAALPEYEIFPQVCMGALIQPPARLYGAWRRRARYAYQAKIVDFTVWDAADNRVICLVELDDPSHDRKKDQDDYRDSLTGEAGYATVRVDVRHPLSCDQLRERVLTAPAPDPPVFACEPEPPAFFGGRVASPRGVLNWGRLGAVVAATIISVLLIVVVVMTFQHALQKTIASIRPAARPGPSYTLSIPSCAVYGDLAAIAQQRARGCSYAETVEFSPALSEPLQRGWAHFNVSRLYPNPRCEQYAQWTQELLADAGDSLLGRQERLVQLFHDAAVQGCLRAPPR